MGIILRLISEGVPIAVIITRYGKKAYDAAKKFLKKQAKEDKKDLALTSVAGATALASMGLAFLKKEKNKKDNLRSSKDKKFSGHTSYKN